MSSYPFTMTSSGGQSLTTLVGNTTSITLNFLNQSTTDRIYNLSITLTLPNGLTVSSATITQTSSVTNADNSITYTWVNLKDLAPAEAIYPFTITIKCASTFKNGSTIPFGYQFPSLVAQGTMDTMPRGAADIGNTVLTSQLLFSCTTVMYRGIVTVPGKVLKGAGTSLSANDYTQVSTATCTLYNNSVSSSLVNITLLLDNGVRYLGNLRSSGTDASQVLSPIISTVIINNKTYTQLFFSTVTLSINSSTTFTFSFAIWNYYDNNLGNLIAHGTSLNMSLSLASDQYTSTSSTNFSAMDVILTTSVSKSSADVQNTLTYSYNYAVGGYYDLNNIILHYFLPDGISYISSSYTPTTVINNSTIKGYYITYNFISAVKNSTTTRTISAKINSYYQYPTPLQSITDSSNWPIVGNDVFTANTDISAITVNQGATITDTAKTSCSITVGTIKKQFLKAYYQDGTPKNITTLAPLDLAGYELSYNASSINAMQKEIYIDDFFPLSADPINNLTYTYAGLQPLTTPQLISPHGVDFYYGTLPGKSSFTIDFAVPISSLGTSTTNVNLMKLKGSNTLSVSYSNRAQVTISIGSPNLKITKSVSGPNPAAIKANEVYTYTVTISNSNTLGTETDAFNFMLTDTLSSWFSLNPNTAKVSGSGIYSNIQITGNTIVVGITSLAPGQSLTLTYNVTTSNLLAPGVTITTTATNTNPYSQPYTQTSPNYQYSNLIKTASTTIASLAINLTKTYTPSIYKVGSTIIYTIQATIPEGTIAYGVTIKDVLSSGNQVYSGTCYRNGVLINPTVSSNTITMPTDGTIDARLGSQTLTYIIYCKILNGTKSINGTTTTQNNTYQCLYQQIAGAATTTLSKTLSVTINHPNIVLTLSCTDQTTSTLYTQTATVSTNSTLLISLVFQNNSSIKLVNGTIQIPIDSSFNFASVITATQCSATFNTSTRMLIINVPSLEAGMSGLLNFTLLPISSLQAGTSKTIQAKAMSYYNDINPTRIYSGETSNIITVQFPAGVSLLPDPITQITSNTSFIVTNPGDTAIIRNYFKNTGGGYDNYTLSIAPVSLSYTIAIDNQIITTVPPNTVYSAQVAALTNVAPNTKKIISITTVIPSTQPLGSRYDFNVTTTSTTSPYPSQTVYNIDPS